MFCESWRVWRSQVSIHKAIRNDIWSIWECSKVIWRGIWARFETAYEKTKNNNSEWFICGLRVLISNVRQRGLQIDRVLSQNRWDWILGDLEMTYKRSASHGDAKWAYLRPWGAISGSSGSDLRRSESGFGGDLTTSPLESQETNSGRYVAWE